MGAEESSNPRMHQQLSKTMRLTFLFSRSTLLSEAARRAFSKPSALFAIIPTAAFYDFHLSHYPNSFLVAPNAVLALS